MTQMSSFPCGAEGGSTEYGDAWRRSGGAGLAGPDGYLAALIKDVAGLINDMVALIEDLSVQISNQTSTRSNLIVPNINLIDQINVRDYRIDVPTHRIDMLPRQHASLAGQIASCSRQHPSFMPQQRTLGGEHSMRTPQHRIFTAQHGLRKTQSSPHARLGRVVVGKSHHFGVQAFAVAVELADLQGGVEGGVGDIDPRQGDLGAEHG